MENSIGSTERYRLLYVEQGSAFKKRLRPAHCICRVCGEKMPGPASHKIRHEKDKLREYYGF